MKPWLEMKACVASDGLPAQLLWMWARMLMDTVTVAQVLTGRSLKLYLPDT